jgi:hypothetical protein
VPYWRPLVPGLNDHAEDLDSANALSQHADATVFTGLFYRDQIAAYYQANGLPEPYSETARRKIVPETLERRVLSVFADSATLFRKTSCAVSYVHALPDYNGHVGIRELCDICPLAQLDRCRQAHRLPTAERIREVACALPEARDLHVVDITERAAVVAGFPDEQPRYYLQHVLGFQVHDVQHPHVAKRHGPRQRAGRCRPAPLDRLHVRHGPGHRAARVMPSRYQAGRVDQIPPACRCGWSSTTSALRKSSCSPPCSTWQPDLEALGLMAMSAGLTTSVLAGQSSVEQAQAVIDYHLAACSPQAGQRYAETSA